MSDQIASSSNQAVPMMKLTRLTKRFNGVTAVNQVDMELHKGELLSLIGPNGSGKTTLFNCVTGFLKPEEGEVYFKGEAITSERPDKIALRGISRTFQNVRIFPGLTVMENLLLSLQQYQEESLWHRTIHSKRIQKLETVARTKAETILDGIGLIDLRDEEAHNLVYGERKMLEFGCALIPDPDLVMLDEPAAGVSTARVDQMKAYILALHAEGKTFLVVEHNMGVVMDISERIVVLDYGKKIAEGTPSEIQQNALVREAYFGS